MALLISCQSQPGSSRYTAMLVACTGAASQIVHFHYHAWPDHGVPSTTQPLRDLVGAVKGLEQAEAGPAVVHCRAGKLLTPCMQLCDPSCSSLIAVQLCRCHLHRQGDGCPGIGPTFAFLHMDNTLQCLCLSDESNSGSTEVPIAGFQSASTAPKQAAGTHGRGAHWRSC